MHFIRFPPVLHFKVVEVLYLNGLDKPRLLKLLLKTSFGR